MIRHFIGRDSCTLHVLRCTEVSQQSVDMGHNQTRAVQQTTPLFDYLIGGGKQWARYEPERFGGLEVDHQLVLGRRLHRQVGRLGAAQDAIDIGRSLLQHVDIVNSVGHEPAGCDEEAPRIDRRANGNVSQAQ